MWYNGPKIIMFGFAAAFTGIDGQKPEMLFITPEERGKGMGRKLMEYGIERFAANELAVNEQGNPYPLLYMKRK